MLEAPAEAVLQVLEVSPWKSGPTFGCSSAPCGRGGLLGPLVTRTASGTLSRSHSLCVSPPGTVAQIGGSWRLYACLWGKSRTWEHGCRTRLRFLGSFTEHCHQTTPLGPALLVGHPDGRHSLGLCQFRVFSPSAVGLLIFAYLIIRGSPSELGV